MASKKKKRFMGQYNSKEKKEGRHQLNQVKKAIPQKNRGRRLRLLVTGVRSK